MKVAVALQRVVTMSNCLNGHSNSIDNLFCSTCGIQLQSGRPRPPVDPLLLNPPDVFSNEPQPTTSTRIAVPNRLTKKGLAIVSATLLVVTLVAALAGVFASEKETTLRAVFTLYDNDIDGGWGDCRGTGGYADFGFGMDVTVRDGKGDIVATATTKSPDTDEIFEILLDNLSIGIMSSWTSDTCTVYFETTLPNKDFYEIEIGRRGSMSFSKSELEDKSYFVSLTLGKT